MADGVTEVSPKNGLRVASNSSKMKAEIIIPVYDIFLAQGRKNLQLNVLSKVVCITDLENV